MTRGVPLLACATALALAVPAAASPGGTPVGAAAGRSDRTGGLAASCAYARTAPSTVTVTGVATSPLAHYVEVTCQVYARGLSASASGTGGPVAVADATVASLPAGPTTVCVTAFAQWTIDVQEHVYRTCRTY